LGGGSRSSLPRKKKLGGQCCEKEMRVQEMGALLVGGNRGGNFEGEDAPVPGPVAIEKLVYGPNNLLLERGARYEPLDLKAWGKREDLKERAVGNCLGDVEGRP